MDKIAKELARLSVKEQKAVKEILQSLQAGNLQGLDIQKLRGQGDIFRVRKGDVRIIYRKVDEKAIFVLAIERRSEKTYKNF